jgi:hypothetical protein
MWGAAAGIYSFIITRDGDDQFLASAKLAGSRPFQGQRHDLGAYNTMTEAEQACEQWYKAQQA